MESDTEQAPDGKGETKGEDKANPKENTGLHDIKAMAKSQKQRISRRISTQSDVEDSLLASSTTGLKAVALPQPGKDAPALAEVVAEEHRGGVPIWIYGAVGVVAVAAVIFFVTRGSGDKQQKTQVAVLETPDRSSEVVPAEPPPALGAIDPTAGAIGQPGVAADEDEGATEPEEPVVTPIADPAPPADDKPAEKSRDSKPAPSRTATGDKPKADKPKDSPPADTKPPAKADPKKPGGAPSIEDMLTEASGGAAGPDVAKTEEKKTPTKTDLNSRDIKNGLKGVAAKSCYGVAQKAGTVMVSITVSPEGKVTKAVPVGDFSKGDLASTGNCVAAEVKKATFPAWDGKAKSFKYSFLVIE